MSAASGPPIADELPEPRPEPTILLVAGRGRRAAPLTLPLILLVAASAVLGYRVGRSDWRGLSWSPPGPRSAPMPVARPPVAPKPEVAVALASEPPAEVKPVVPTTRQALAEIQQEAEAKKAERAALEHLKQEEAEQLAQGPRRAPVPNPNARQDLEHQLRLITEAQRQQVDRMLAEHLAHQRQFAELVRDHWNRQGRPVGNALPGLAGPGQVPMPRAPSPVVRQFVLRRAGPGYQFRSRTVIITQSRHLFPGR